MAKELPVRCPLHQPLLANISPANPREAAPLEAWVWLPVIPTKVLLGGAPGPFPSPEFLGFSVKRQRLPFPSLPRSPSCEPWRDLSEAWMCLHSCKLVEGTPRRGPELVHGLVGPVLHWAKDRSPSPLPLAACFS